MAPLTSKLPMNNKPQIEAKQYTIALTGGALKKVRYLSFIRNSRNSAYVCVGEMENPS